VIGAFNLRLHHLQLFAAGWRLAAKTRVCNLSLRPRSSQTLFRTTNTPLTNPLHSSAQSKLRYKYLYNQHPAPPFCQSYPTTHPTRTKRSNSRSNSPSHQPTTAHHFLLHPPPLRHARALTRQHVCHQNQSAIHYRRERRRGLLQELLSLLQGGEAAAQRERGEVLCD